MPRCRSYWITEFDLAIPVVGRNPQNDESWLAAWRFGHMWNVGRMSALGGAVGLHATPQGVRFDFLARYRRWITPNTAVDLSPGVFAREVGDYTWVQQTYVDSFGVPFGTYWDATDYRTRTRIGFAGTASIVFGSGFGLNARIETAQRLSPSPSDASNPARPVSVWLGASFSGRPGILTGTIVPAATFIVALVAFATCGGCGA